MSATDAVLKIIYVRNTLHRDTRGDTFLWGGDGSIACTGWNQVPVMLCYHARQAIELPCEQ